MLRVLKIIVSSSLVFVLILSTCLVSFCANGSFSCYTNLTSSSSQTDILVLSYLNKLHSIDEHYVVFCDSQNSYYLVYGTNLSTTAGGFNGQNVNYIHYTTTGTGTNSHYTLDNGSYTSFSLTPNRYTVVSDISYQTSVRSNTHSTFKFQYLVIGFLVLILAFVLFKALKRDRGAISL